MLHGVMYQGFGQRTSCVELVRRFYGPEKKRSATANWLRAIISQMAEEKQSRGRIVQSIFEEIKLFVFPNFSK